MNRRIWASLAALCLLPSVSLAAAGESFQLMRVGRVYLDDISAGRDGKPIVDLYLRVETRIGEPLASLTASDIVIRDNGDVIESGSVEVQPLAEAALGTSAVLVLDTSRTMRGDPFDQAKAASLRFLDRMGDFDHVAIVAFDDDVQVVSDFGAPRTAARVALEELEVQPKTLSKLVWDGVNKAVDLLAARPSTLPRRSFVILFSDGRDSNSVHSLEEVSALAAGDSDVARTPIFAIGYSRFGAAGLDSLKTLSRSTGGGYFKASTPSDLRRFYDEIWKRMTGSLVVRYPGEMDGLRHVVEVTIGDKADSRDASFPEISTPIWPWVLGVVALLCMGGAVFYYVQTRSAGRLIFEGGPRSGQAIELKGTKLRVGALDENDLVLNFPTVSRYHAQLHIRGSKLELEDLGSRNGTFVNGTQVGSRSDIHHGDRIRFGDVEMILRA